ncbi:hypothetical protein KC345_g7560 [Hortaea werneckii]|nr:hypothetical protein KC345_g7560 [Hortaea werneckii]
MPPNQYSVTDTEFLMWVINNTQGGTIDYKAIGAAVGMPTVKAATCKFWRLKKAYTLAGDGEPATKTSTKDGAAGGTKSGKEKKVTAKSAPSKKRKLSEAAHSEGEEGGEKQGPDLKLSKKIDWQKVADECNIVTKGAAAKRFSRMKAKREAGGNNGTEASPNGENASPEASAKKPRQRNTPRKPALKKRKVEESEETPEAQDTVKEEEEELICQSSGILLHSVHRRMIIGRI